MLCLLARPELKTGGAVGKVLEFAGPGLAQLALGERATLTNMAVEAGAFTGIIAADEVVIQYLMGARGLSRAELEPKVVQADPDAEYAFSIELDLTRVPIMSPCPATQERHPAFRARAARRLRGAHRHRLRRFVHCGKTSDMDLYADVIREALERACVSRPACSLPAIRLAKRAPLRAERGYLELFEKVGASLLDPSCGACIRAGPGTSSSAEQVT